MMMSCMYALVIQINRSCVEVTGKEREGKPPGSRRPSIFAYT